MDRWKEYQEEAAAFFSTLGLDATTDERLVGVRAEHDVDVVVRSRRAGLEQFWVVECKCWRRRVDKLHVAALAEIVHDVGADRGILLSEVGFQAGAVRMSQKSNITLTSLADLGDAAAEELMMLNLGESRRRLLRVSDRLSSVGKRTHFGGGGIQISFKQAPGRWTSNQLYAAVGVAQMGLGRAETGRWPAPYAWDFDNDKVRSANDVKSFASAMAAVLVQIEAELTAFEKANE